MMQRSSALVIFLSAIVVVEALSPATVFFNDGNDQKTTTWNSTVSSYDTVTANYNGQNVAQEGRSIAFDGRKYLYDLRVAAGTAEVHRYERADLTAAATTVLTGAHEDSRTIVADTLPVTSNQLYIIEGDADGIYRASLNDVGGLNYPVEELTGFDEIANAHPNGHLAHTRQSFTSGAMYFTSANANSIGKWQSVDTQNSDSMVDDIYIDNVCAGSETPTGVAAGGSPLTVYWACSDNKIHSIVDEGTRINDAQDNGANGRVDVVDVPATGISGTGNISGLAFGPDTKLYWSELGTAIRSFSFDGSGTVTTVATADASTTTPWNIALAPGCDFPMDGVVQEGNAVAASAGVVPNLSGFLSLGELTITIKVPRTFTDCGAAEIAFATALGTGVPALPSSFDYDGNATSASDSWVEDSGHALTDPDTANTHQFDTEHEADCYCYFTMKESDFLAFTVGAGVGRLTYGEDGTSTAWNSADGTGTPIATNRVFQDTRVTHAAAQANCESLGGHLPSIHSLAEHDQLLADWVAEDISVDPSRTWIGLTDTKTEGLFAWTDQTAPDYENWRAGWPDASTPDDDCAMILNPLFGWEGWMDVTCNAGIAAYFCDIPVEANPKWIVYTGEFTVTGKEKVQLGTGALKTVIDRTVTDRQQFTIAFEPQIKVERPTIQITFPADPDPTNAPTASPTASPTAAPTASPEDPEDPTNAPTASPTAAPTASPEDPEDPTNAPTASPTAAPTDPPVLEFFNVLALQNFATLNPAAECKALVEFEMATLSGWPFKVTSLNITGGSPSSVYGGITPKLAEGEDENDCAASDSSCTQTWSFDVCSSACEADGTIDLSFEIGCQTTYGAPCPSEANVPAVITTNTDNFCFNLVENVQPVAGVLQAYTSAAFGEGQQTTNFEAGDTGYFRGEFSSASLAIENIAVLTVNAKDTSLGASSYDYLLWNGAAQILADVKHGFEFRTDEAGDCDGVGLEFEVYDPASNSALSATSSASTAASIGFKLVIDGTCFAGTTDGLVISATVQVQFAGIAPVILELSAPFGEMKRRHKPLSLLQAAADEGATPRGSAQVEVGIDRPQGGEGSEVQSEKPEVSSDGEPNVIIEYYQAPAKESNDNLIPIVVGAVGGIIVIAAIALLIRARMKKREKIVHDHPQIAHTPVVVELKA